MGRGRVEGQKKKKYRKTEREPFACRRRTIGSRFGHCTWRFFKLFCIIRYNLKNNNSFLSCVVVIFYVRFRDSYVSCRAKAETPSPARTGAALDSATAPFTTTATAAAEAEATAAVVLRCFVAAVRSFPSAVVPLSHGAGLLRGIAGGPCRFRRVGTRARRIDFAIRWRAQTAECLRASCAAAQMLIEIDNSN